MPPPRRLTPQSLHILVNLERVVPKPYKLDIDHGRRRSQLDGIECTAQITSLVVGGYAREDADGKLTRTPQGELAFARAAHKHAKPSALLAYAARP